MSSLNNDYDYIIAGAGAAGLSLAWKLLHSQLAEKKVLIIDSNLQPTNDKTWCFWDSNCPPFADIIHKKWKKIEIGITNSRFTQSLNEYPYYCIREIDFQQKIYEQLRAHNTFELVEAQITDLEDDADHATLHSKQQSYSADYIFQSCFPANKQDKPHYSLWQHFLGWDITTTDPTFDAATCTLMDFDNTFTKGIAFIYILPWSATSALVEYTVFSDQVAEKEFYEDKISLYLNNRFDLQPIDYSTERREFGKIPMQDRLQKAWYKPRILNLGLQGGLTKPSTGYTFKRIQDHTDAIILQLQKNNTPKPITDSSFRYQAFDLWLLQIIHDHPQESLEVFKQLFKQNTADQIFRFLGEETSVTQDLAIMNSVPYTPFLRAIWETRGRLWEMWSNY